jgi:hypothetical protein
MLVGSQLDWSPSENQENLTQFYFPFCVRYESNAFEPAPDRLSNLGGTILLHEVEAPNDDTLLIREGARQCPDAARDEYTGLRVDKELRQRRCFQPCGVGGPGSSAVNLPLLCGRDLPAPRLPRGAGAVTNRGLGNSGRQAAARFLVGLRGKSLQLTSPTPKENREGDSDDRQYRPARRVSLWRSLTANSDEQELVPTDLTVQPALPVSVAEIDRQTDY